MKPQEIFETVSRHLFTQGHQALGVLRNFDATGCCMYHSRNGYKCAVGILIPDENYSPELEGRGLKRLIDLPDLKALIPTFVWDNYELVTQLQVVHDVSSNWTTEAHLRHALKKVATEHGLNATFLETLQFSQNELVTIRHAGTTISS